MCVGAVQDQSLQGPGTMSVGSVGQGKDTGRVKRNVEERKEKSRYAARDRRAKESDCFQELEDLLGEAGAELQEGEGRKVIVDKTSLIRLTVAQLKCREIVKIGLGISDVKEESSPPVSWPDFLSCLDGFSLVLGRDAEIIHVSNNVRSYIGLGSVDLLGQTLGDFIHPCDQSMLASLTTPIPAPGEERRVEVMVRVKCTVTERGRMVNLTQANYKPLRVCGVTRLLSKSGGQGVSGPVFLGTASTVGPDMGIQPQRGVFYTKHTADMHLAEMDGWMSDVAGYSVSSLLGKSFYHLVHGLDTSHIQEAFTQLREQGQCQTAPYRLLVKGGGYCWLQTRASCRQPRRGSGRGPTIQCQHSQLTEVQDTASILASIQQDGRTGVRRHTDQHHVSCINSSNLHQRENSVIQPPVRGCQLTPRTSATAPTTNRQTVQSQGVPRKILLVPPTVRSSYCGPNTQSVILTRTSPGPSTQILQPRILQPRPSSDTLQPVSSSKTITQHVPSSVYPTDKLEYKANKAETFTPSNESKTRSYPSFSEGHKSKTDTSETPLSGFQAPFPATSQIFSGFPTPKPATTSIFSGFQQTAKTITSHISTEHRAINQEVHPESSRRDTMTEQQQDLEESSFFAALFDCSADVLERLSPHSGDECVSLEEPHSASFSSIDTSSVPLEGLNFGDRNTVNDFNGDFCQFFDSQDQSFTSGPTVAEIGRDIPSPSLEILWGSKYSDPSKDPGDTGQQGGGESHGPGDPRRLVVLPCRERERGEGMREPGKRLHSHTPQGHRDGQEGERSGHKKVRVSPSVKVLQKRETEFLLLKE